MVVPYFYRIFIVNLQPMKPNFIYNDGGRLDAGYKGTTGDCGVRAIAIVTGLPYQQVYDMVNNFQGGYKQRKTGRKSNARTGVWQQDVKKIMESLGWVWVPTMFIGQGCKTHLIMVIPCLHNFHPKKYRYVSRYLSGHG